MDRNQAKKELWPIWINLDSEIREFLESFDDFVDEVLLELPELEKDKSNSKEEFTVR